MITSVIIMFYLISSIDLYYVKKNQRVRESVCHQEYFFQFPSIMCVNPARKTHRDNILDY